MDLKTVNTDRRSKVNKEFKMISKTVQLALLPRPCNLKYRAAGLKLGKGFQSTHQKFRSFSAQLTPLWRARCLEQILSADAKQISGNL